MGEAPGNRSLTGARADGCRIAPDTTKGACGETGLEELYQANLWKKGQDAMKDAAKAGK